LSLITVCEWLGKVKVNVDLYSTLSWSHL